MDDYCSINACEAAGTASFAIVNQAIYKLFFQIYAYQIILDRYKNSC